MEILCKHTHRLFFTALVMAAPNLAAQDRATPAARSVNFQNLSGYAREEWITVSVPFERGTVAENPDMHVEGAAHTVWQPFGARWPDGSVRQAVCMFRLNAPANSEHSLALLPGRGTEAPSYAPALVPHTLTFKVTIDGKVTSATPSPVRVLEHNAARQVVLARCRIGATGLVGEVTYESFSGQTHGYVSIAVFFSDPTSKDMTRHVDRIAVETVGAGLFLRHHDQLGVTTELSETGSNVILLKDDHLADGQGIRRGGALVPPLREDESLHDSTIFAAITHRPLGATSWRGYGAFGVYGYVPQVPAHLANGRAREVMAQRHAKFIANGRGGKMHGDPFQRGPHMLTKTPSQTGEQSDFGIVQLEPVASTGLPTFLHEVELSILQEACRPNHFYETDTRPVSQDNHPDWIIWVGRTHYHSGMSKDRLGKPPEAEKSKFDTHGWKGKKRSHWSSNYLGAYYLLTGDPVARLELENEIRLFMAGETVDKRFVTSGSSGARALGRTLHAASWMYLATGDEPLLQRMVDRVEQVGIREWAGRDFPEERVRPYRIAKPDGRNFAGKCMFWPPWINALCVNGVGAVYLLTGNESAKTLADGLALNLLRHGWRVLDNGSAAVVYAMQWKPDGEPLTAAEENHPDFVHLSSSIALWALPAVEWARHAAAERGDGALVARAEDILRRMRTRRKPPRDGWFDRFDQWDAVRLPIADR